MKILHFIVFSLFISNSVIAQLKDGTKVYTLNIGAFSISSEDGQRVDEVGNVTDLKANGFSVSMGGTYGKIKKNRLFSYGINLSYQHIQYSDIVINTYSITPCIRYQKFYPITDKFYFSPHGNFKIGYIYSREEPETNKGIIISTELNPIALTYCFNSKTSLVFYVGSFVLEYDYTKNYRDGFDPTYRKVYDSNFNLDAKFSGIGFMVQKYF